MKVINIYNKDSDLRCYNRNIFRATEKLLAKYPYEYGECYRHNIETLELIQVDRFFDRPIAGVYDPDDNTIFFNSECALGHELFHMASNDFKNGQYAFSSRKELENGLIEGMTEYFKVKAYNLDGPDAYPFEVFCVTMMEDIPNIFKPYFIPNSSEFISLFPNRRDIYNLLYSLDVYNNMYLEFLANDIDRKEQTVDMRLLRNNIKEVFNALIDIELSLENDPDVFKQYDYKFMDYICSNRLKLLFNELYPRYYEYADKLIDQKIRKRMM